MIFAMDENYWIWKNNGLCWSLKQDLKFFSEKTKWKTVIMWKNTWISLPDKFKPLPWRKNIVVSSSLKDLKGCEIYNNLEQAIKSSVDETFLIWWKRIYQEGIKYADKIYITQVYWKFDCDVFLDKDFIKKVQKDFKLYFRSWKKRENNIDFEFLEYIKV